MCAGGGTDLTVVAGRGLMRERPGPTGEAALRRALERCFAPVMGGPLAELGTMLRARRADVIWEGEFVLQNRPLRWWRGSFRTFRSGRGRHWVRVARGKPIHQEKMRTWGWISTARDERMRGQRVSRRQRHKRVRGCSSIARIARVRTNPILPRSRRRRRAWPAAATGWRPARISARRPTSGARSPAGS